MFYAMRTVRANGPEIGRSRGTRARLQLWALLSLAQLRTAGNDGGQTPLSHERIDASEYESNS
jgi:hypothetical protein